MARQYGQKRTDPKTKVEGTKSFSLGLSQLGHPSVIKPNELAESQNAMYTLNGVLEKRPGSTVLGAIRGSSTKLNAMKAVYDINGVDYFLRISDDGILQKYVWASNLWVDVSGSPTFSNKKTAIVQAWGEVYIMNETDNMVSWDGTTFTTNTAIADPTVAPTVVITGSGKVELVKIGAGGTGYSVGNVLTVTGGDGNCQLTVATVSSGAVTSVTITNPGLNYNLATAVATTVAPAGGTGCTINITSVIGKGTTAYYWKYAWQNSSGNTVASAYVSALNLPNPLTSTTYATLTLPAAPVGATKTMIFKGRTAGDEYFLDSIDPTVLTYKDDGSQDNSDNLWAAPTENNTTGMHFKDGIVCMYMDTLCGVTTELGDHCLVFSAGGDKMRSFGTADGAGFFYWKKGDGDKITGIHEFQESLYVFKQYKIGAFKFSTDSAVAGTMSTVSLASGAVSHDSIHAAGNDLRYWSPDGAMSLGNEPNFAAVVRTKVIDENNKERLFFSDALSANVLEAWSGRSDNGNPIVWRVSTKQFDANVSYKYKTYNRVYFVFGNVSGGNTRVILTENGFNTQDPLAMYASNVGQQGFGVDEWGSMEFGSSSGDPDENASGINVRYADVGYKDLFSLQATFTNDGLTDTLQLMGMFIEYSDSELPLPSNYQLMAAY